MTQAALELAIVVRARDLASKVIRDIGPTARRAGAVAQRAFTGVSRASLAMAAKVRGAASAMGGALKRALFGLPGLASAAFAGAGAVATGKLISIASDAEEIGSKFEVVFRGVGEEASATAETIAQSMGRSQQDVQAFMSTLQDTFVPLGFTREQGLALSDTLTRLSIDVASFNNAQDEDVLRDFQSALVGNTETVRKYGIVMLESTVKQEAYRMGIAETGAELTESQKVQARLSLIIKGSTDAMGDAIRTQDSYANQVKRFKAQVTDLSVAFGQQLIDAIQDTVKNLGGAEQMGNLLSLGLQFLTEMAIGVIHQFGEMARFALDVIEKLGGMERAQDLVSRSVAFLGDVFRTAWAAVKIVFIGFVNGLKTIAFVGEAVWSLLKILAGFLALGFLTAIQLTIKGLLFLAQGFDKLAVVVQDGFLFVLDKALIALRKLSGATASVADFLGLDSISRKAREAAQAIEGFRQGASMVSGQPLLEEFRKDLEATEGMVRERQLAVVGFIEETWEGLGETATNFADDMAQSQPNLLKVWEEFKSAGIDALDKGESIVAAMGPALKAAAAAAKTGKSAGVEVGENAAEGILEGVANQKEAIQAGLAALGSGEGTGEEQGGFFAAIKEGFLSVAKSAGIAGEGVTTYKLAAEGAKDVSRLLLGGFDDLTSSAIQGAQSMGEAWERLKVQVVAAIAQMIAKMLALKALQAILGFFSPATGGGGGGDGGGGGNLDLPSRAMGGTLPGSVLGAIPLKSFAMGGIADGPTLALMGDNPVMRKEAFVPLPDGRSIPVTINEGGGGSNVTFQITTLDARDFDTMLGERRGMIVGMIQDATVRKRSLRTAIADV